MTELIGQTLLGRYRVEASLGRGGMAEVYKVWDEHRSVHLAMKLLREDLAEDKIFLRRFRREAQTLERLQHPNIVRFYGLEQDGDLAFMLMDYVEGTTLRKEILRADGPFCLDRVLEILRPICAALNYAHRQGMVHCDVKPGNIMIDAGGRVLITDFGIARMTESATATMVGLGTPAYMAPELVRGEDPTPQTDIYALGVVLYEMLTGGERPFTGERATITGSTSEKVRWEQMHLRPTSPKDHDPDIPSALDAVVLRCLEKEPGSRYPSVLDLLNDLERTAAPVDSRLPVETGMRPSQLEARTPLPPPATPVIHPAASDAHAQAAEKSLQARGAGFEDLRHPAAGPGGEAVAPLDVLGPAKGALSFVRLWLLWSVATVVGVAVGWPLAERPWEVSFSDTVFVLLLGTAVGASQWLVLRGRVRHAGWWIVATAAGFATWEWIFRVLNTSPAIAGAAYGMAIGILQWILVWRRVPRSLWWILASGLGQGATQFLLVYSRYASPVISHTLLALVTGVAAAILLRRHAASVPGDARLNATEQEQRLGHSTSVSHE